MIVVAIIGILAAIILPMFSGGVGNHETSYGFGGTTETRCHGGMKVVVGQRGYVQQLMDQNGHGVPCN